VVFAHPGDMTLLGSRTLEGLNFRVEPRLKRLVDAGPAPAAAGVDFQETRPEPEVSRPRLLLTRRKAAINRGHAPAAELALDRVPVRQAGFQTIEELRHSRTHGKVAYMIRLGTKLSQTREAVAKSLAQAGGQISQPGHDLIQGQGRRPSKPEERIHGKRDCCGNDRREQRPGYLRTHGWQVPWNRYHGTLSWPKGRAQYPIPQPSGVPDASTTRGPWRGSAA